MFTSKSHKPDPYVAFKDDQLRYLALKHLEEQLTIRRVAMTLGSVASAAAAVCVVLIKSGWLTTT